MGRALDRRVARLERLHELARRRYGAAATGIVVAVIPDDCPDPDAFLAACQAHAGGRQVLGLNFVQTAPQGPDTAGERP